MNARLAIRGLAVVLVAVSVAPAAEPKEEPAITTFLPSPSTPLVALRLVFSVGSADDAAGKEGLAALTASMVAEGGTKEFRYEEILQRFYPMAASLDVRCGKDLTVFSGVVHRDNLASYRELLTAMLTTPRFAAEDFDRLRDQGLDYVTKTLRGGNDEELGKWTLQTAIYRSVAGQPQVRHPYGHPDRGTVAGLKSITLDDVKLFYKDHYRPAFLHLGVAGGADAAFLKQLQTDLARLPSAPGAAVLLPSAPNAPRGTEITIVEKPADSTAISIGFPFVPNLTRKDDDFYALAVANSYLGEHRTFNGKLMQDLRGKRGLNYGDYSYIEDFIQDGAGTFPVPNNFRKNQYFSIWVRPVPHDKAAFALRAALWELDRLIEKGMSPAEFEATRSFLLNYSKLWVQTLPRRLGFAMDGASYGRDDLVTELARRLPRLTVDQVNAAVRKQLMSSGICVAIVTRDAKGLRETLVSGKPTPIVYDTQGTPDEILAEDKQIAAFPLKDLRVTIVPASAMFEK